MSTALQPLPDRGGPAQPLLTATGLRKYFALAHRTVLRWPGAPRAMVRAVDGVSFTVVKGETLGVVGESGCGKSTLARLLVRLFEPDAGELVFDGDPVGSVRGLPLRVFRRSVQMVFQDSHASLNPRLTVGDAIAYGPRVHGEPAALARARSAALLDRVGLAPAAFAPRYPHELSGGQRQRVNIARALAFEPRLLILDESVAALDTSVQAQVLNLLQALKAERQLTYLFISHDLNVVRYMADRVMVMYLGVVVETGRVEQVFERPRHPYTRALLSAMPSMDPRHRRSAPPLAGDPPNPVDPPSGCRFRDRCPRAVDRCAESVPVLREGAPGHWAACLRDGEVHE